MFKENTVSANRLVENLMSNNYKVISTYYSSDSNTCVPLKY